jgi:FKBP-type peptidyl-prolyl cis-trans isomerase 2
MVNERIEINMNKIKYLFLAVLSFGITACSTGPKIESGSIVKVDYKGTLEDGTVFDTTEGKKPLVFMVGAGQVIPAFEEKITQLAIGQTKKFTIKSVDAYGETDNNKVVKLPRDERFDSVELKEGAVIFANNKTPEGKEVQTPMKIVSFDDAEVTLDYNHPLAGKDLTFEVTVVEVNEPKSQANNDTKAINNEKQKNPAS